MKKLIIFLIPLFYLNANSQNITVYDLSMLNQLTDINLITNFLVNTRGFTYQGNFGKDEGGWNIYKYSNNGNNMEVGISSKIAEGKLIELTQVRYIISLRSEFESFFKSLNTYNFKKTDGGKYDNGDTYEIYTGTNSLKDQLTMVFILKTETFYKISIS